MAPSVDPNYVARNPAWLDKAYAVLDNMVVHGNLVAEYRKNELLQVDALLRHAMMGVLPPTEDAAADLGVVASSDDAAVDAEALASFLHEAPSSIFGTEAMEDMDIFETGLTRKEILGVADAINDADVAWMCDTIDYQSIW